MRFSCVHLLSSGSQTWRTKAQLLYRSSLSYTPRIHKGVILRQSGSRNNGCDFKWQVTPRKWSCHGMGRSSTKSSVRCVAALSARSGTKGLPKNKSKNEPVWMHKNRTYVSWNGRAVSNNFRRTRATQNSWQCRALLQVHKVLPSNRQTANISKKHNAN